MDMATLTSVFGWMSLFNVLILLVTSIALTGAGTWVAGIHTRLTGVDAAQLRTQYFSYLANYKIAILVLNIVPYLALRMVA